MPSGAVGVRCHGESWLGQNVGALNEACFGLCNGSHCAPPERWPRRGSLMDQWLGLCASTSRGPGSIPGWGTKMPHATFMAKKKRRKEKKKNMSKS